MINYAPNCPHCHSSETASRRSLFHQLMHRGQLGGPFAWYTLEGDQVLPPKSLLVVVCSAMLVLALPAAAFWYLQNYAVTAWLASAIGILLLSLLVDVLLTYHRYKHWAGQWLCGECQCVFSAVDQRGELVCSE